MQRDALALFASGQPAAAVSAEGGAAPDAASGAASGAAPVATAAADPAAAGQDGPARRVSVVGQVLRAQSIDDAVLLRGQTAASREVEVRAETAGRIVSEPLRRGAFVNAGDVLCRLDPGTRAAALAEAEARLSDATLGARNAERLTEGGYGSETRVLAARAALQSAEAGVEAARREIERLEIRAPFAGLLEDDAAELGALLQPGGLCATVTQLDPIRLVGYVPEAEVDRVAPGAMAGGRLASGREVVGRVTYVSRIADPQTRTFRTEVTVPNAALDIRDGQTVEMLIRTEGVEAHLVPGSALTLDDDGRLGVRVVDEDSRARFVPVGVLRDTVDGMWVSGLPPEVTLIVLGQEYVTDGVPVDVTLRSATE
jgi:multidrug efflux system membrane fusion protein